MSSELVIKSSDYTEEEQAQTISAYQHFLKKEFDVCLSMLKKLQKSHPGDPKLLHNKAVTDFLKSGQTKLTEFKKNISKLQILTQKLPSEDDESVDEKENCGNSTLLYNHALLLFNLHQYRESRSYLETLLNDVEDKVLLHSIYLLLIDALVLSHQSEQAIHMISKIEQLWQQKADDTPRLAQLAEQARPHILFMKTQCYLQMKAMKACKRELKSVATYFGNEQRNSANVMYENIMSIILKCKFEYQRGNYMKAYKLLGSTPAPTIKESNGQNFNAIYNNNLGIIYSSLNKHTLGSYYVLCALESNDAVLSKNGNPKQITKSLPVLNQNLRHVLMYNMGIQLLHTGKATAAFDCLLVTVQVYYNNPRLWLRLAECCIQANEKQESVAKQPLIKFSLVGSGKHRKLVIGSESNSKGTSGNSVMPIPTIDFASVCLQNALVIINGPQNKQGKIACDPGPMLSGAEINGLHASVLLSSAYVSLRLGNNLLAYQYATQALSSIPDMLPQQKHLCKMYAGEALCHLDKISDAIQQLNSLVNDQQKNSKDIPVAKDAHYFYRSSDNMQSCAIVNLAIAHSYRSELDKSATLLQQLNGKNQPEEAKLLSAYLHCHSSGGTGKALQVLKEKHPTSM